MTPKLLPLKPISARRLMVFADVSCQSCAVPLWGKLARLMVAGAVPDRYLLITMIVRAPSAERCAAKAAKVSGLDIAAAILVSPKADLLPS